MQLISISQAATLLPPADPPHGVTHGTNRAVRTIEDAVIAESVRPRLSRKLDRFSQIGLTLMHQLGDTLNSVDRTRAGLLIGNDLGGWGYVEEQLDTLIATRQETAINPYVATAWFPAAAQGEISIVHDMLGYSKTFSSGMLGAGLAIEHAVRRLQDGTLDLAIAGGIEAPDAAIVVRALQAEGRISESHPASEAGCLIALRRIAPEDADAGGKDGAIGVLSFARRSPAQAIEDVAKALHGDAPIDLYLPALAADDPRQGEIQMLHNLASARLTGTLRRLSFAARGDVGSTSFALAFAAAAGLSQLTPPAPAARSLILGTDFEGLFLAAAVIRPDRTAGAGA